MKVKKKFLSSLTILIGTTIGAGVLGIPYVAAKSGFIISIAHIILLGAIVLLINLYFGEVILRTKGKHHLSGYASKYLGKRGKFFMDLALIFAVYSAIIAYNIGLGESFSFLFFNNLNYSFVLALIFSSFMAFLVWRGLKGLKKYEKIGVGVILSLLILIIAVFFNDVSITNLTGFNLKFLFFPFGVVLFALLSFTALPEAVFALGSSKKFIKQVSIYGVLISVIFYLLFTFFVVGAQGSNTPEVATLSLGAIFIILGILTMVTSYIALGNALQDHFLYDFKYSKKKAWFFAVVLPIFIFSIIHFANLFSFTIILSIGGVVSGGLMAILILLMVKKAKNNGDIKPAYSIFINRSIIFILSSIFILGIIKEVFSILRNL